MARAFCCPVQEEDAEACSLPTLSLIKLPEGRSQVSKDLLSESKAVGARQSKMSQGTAPARAWDDL